MGSFNFVVNLVLLLALSSLILSCKAEEDSVSLPPVTKARPKYATLQRAKPKSTSATSTTTTTTTPTPEKEDNNENSDSSEEDDEPPRIISNGRGGILPPEKVAVPESEKSSEEEKNNGGEEHVASLNKKGRYSSSGVTPSSGGRRYVEYKRPGATERVRTTTTRAPRKRTKPAENARPEGCNQCRYYCKQCRGAEEVTYGGVWGCCNHNCCGGRCSCQKVKEEM